MVRLKDWGLSLATRALGSEVRDVILREIRNQGNTVVSFEGITGVSSSFADECFAKTMVEMGEESFLSKVKLIGASKFAKTIILSSFEERLRANRALVSR